MVAVDEAKLNLAEEELRLIPRDKLVSILNKSATVMFKCSISEKAKMVKRASSFGLTLTDLILRQFRICEEILEDMPLFDLTTKPQNGEANPSVSVKTNSIDTCKRSRTHISGPVKARMKKELVKQIKANVSIKAACKIVGITPPTFQSWRKKDKAFGLAVGE